MQKCWVIRRAGFSRGILVDSETSAHFFPIFFPLGLISEILLMEGGWLESSEGWL